MSVFTGCQSSDVDSQPCLMSSESAPSRTVYSQYLTPGISLRCELRWGLSLPSFRLMSGFSPWSVTRSSSYRTVLRHPRSHPSYDSVEFTLAVHDVPSKCFRGRDTCSGCDFLYSPSVNGVINQAPIMCITSYHAQHIRKLSEG